MNTHTPPPDPEEIDNRLTGWRWEPNPHRHDPPPIRAHYRLQAPNFWVTKIYATQNKAVAEALRYVRSQQREIAMAPKRKPQPPVVEENPPLTDAEQDALQALGWQPAGQSILHGQISIRAKAPDGTFQDATRDVWRLIISLGKPAPGAITLPAVPPDLPGWQWERSEFGCRLVLSTDGLSTPWGSDPDLSLAKARAIVASERAVAEAEAPIRTGGSLRLSGTSVVLHRDLIRTDGGTQPRAGIDPAHVERLREALDAGAILPPIVVYHDGSGYWLADGFHRMEALAQDDGVNVMCDIRQGSRRDAVLHSVSANRSHGLPRSREDVRRAIETLLRDPEWGVWSDREIARQVGCSPSTVGSVRSTVQVGQLPTRMGADGKERALPKPAPKTDHDHLADEFEAIRERGATSADHARLVEIAIQADRSGLFSLSEQAAMAAQKLRAASLPAEPTANRTPVSDLSEPEPFTTPADWGEWEARAAALPGGKLTISKDRMCELRINGVVAMRRLLVAMPDSWRGVCATIETHERRYQPKPAGYEDADDPVDLDDGTQEAFLALPVGREEEAQQQPEPAEPTPQAALDAILSRALAVDLDDGEAAAQALVQAWRQAQWLRDRVADVSAVERAVIHRGHTLLSRLAPIIGVQVVITADGNGWRVAYPGNNAEYTALNLVMAWRFMLGLVSVTLQKLAHERGANLIARGGEWKLVAGREVATYLDGQAAALWLALKALPEPAAQPSPAPVDADAWQIVAPDGTATPMVDAEPPLTQTLEVVAAEPPDEWPLSEIEDEDGRTLVSLDTRGMSDLAGEAFVQLTAAIRHLLRGEAHLVDTPLLAHIRTQVQGDSGHAYGTLVTLLDLIEGDAEALAHTEALARTGPSCA